MSIKANLSKATNTPARKISPTYPGYHITLSFLPVVSVNLLQTADNAVQRKTTTANNDDAEKRHRNASKMLA